MTKQVPADEWDEEKAAKAAYGDYVRKLKSRVDAPADARRAKKDQSRAEVHRLRHREGLSIAQTMVRLGKQPDQSPGYMLRLEHQHEPTCIEACPANLAGK